MATSVTFNSGDRVRINNTHIIESLRGREGTIVGRVSLLDVGVMYIVGLNEAMIEEDGFRSAAVLVISKRLEKI